MIGYGMPALIELKDIEAHCALCAKLGLHFVELNTNFPTQQLHLLDAEALRELAKRYGIFYTIHLNDEMPVADFNPTVAKGYVDAVLEAIAFAKKVDAPLLNMHISQGALCTLPDGIVYFYDAYEENYLEGMAKFRDACEAAIGSSGIHICMENSKAYHSFQKKALDLLLESKVFNLTLDVGHDYCSSFVDEDWILARKSRLQHMHIHDAKNGKQDHLPLGEGEISLKPYFDLAEELDATVLLEVKTADGLAESLKWLKNSRRIK